jgi:lysophospholipase L1-like esterase
MARILLFLLILALQFGIFEAAMRVWGSSEAAPSFQGLFTGDPVIGYRLKPGATVRFTTSEFDIAITINGSGVRDDEEIPPKAADERRIVVLGDSLVLSVQVPFQQTFGELLERRLNATPSPHRYRVINAGVQGYGPVEEMLFFRRVAANFEPDIVLTALFVGNDAEEAVTSEPKLDEGTRSTAARARESLTTRARRIVRRSMVLQVLRLRLTQAAARIPSRAGPPEPPLQSYAARPAARIGKGLAITRKCMDTLGAEVEARGATMAVVLMPARFQVDDADFGRLRETVQQAGGELARDGANALFLAALADAPYPRFDVLPALRRAAAVPPDLFFQETVHLTPRGHEILAEALEGFLRDSGLLETRRRGR